ncbi:MAG: valine--tRNA ligase [Flavobacteriaceae bacterium]|tara:strand:+ start:2958 stop:5585 length:2628 start_codon:yes stop_codon:yes gene_type:complete
MPLSTKFDPSEIEEKWYKYWLEKKLFKSKPNSKKPYTIVIPPPNVTGVLHMGHMLNNTIQDILVRRARMSGMNSCWVPGTDHASIATEAKVVSYLKERGINKKSLSRDEFLKYAWDWTHKYGGIILEQLKRIGCSCDWDRTKFTLDDELYKSVIKVFIQLYEKNLIYRENKMVNWDPKAETTLSDEEVIYEEKQGLLFYISYQIQDSSNKISIATTRPETIFGDTAVCVNPTDERYKKLIGKKVVVPISNRLIPIIEDEYVDSTFGTGALKITPAHDLNDNLIGKKHKLKSIDIFNPNGTLNENGLHYQGMDRFDVRKKIHKELKENEFLIKVENYSHNVGVSERTKVVIEPRISKQWFLKMNNISKPALDAVFKTKRVKLHPKKFQNTYKHWLENIRDWNISRQLWWGHRIPVFYYGKGEEDFVVAENMDMALDKIKNISGFENIVSKEVIQDPDVLDTWFSSWLWPMSVFDGICKPENPEFKYYYPTQDLVTGPDIIFFWVIRMIISGYKFTGKEPFKNIYFTGLVRDKKRQKMSKQLGNSPDPLKLIDIYGADAVRVGLMLSSSAGNDLLFDESLCKQGKNFANKIWNSYRLISSWEVDEKNENIVKNLKIINWYENNLHSTINQVNKNFDNFRISDSLMLIYKLIWDDFCSWLLETIKPDSGKSVSGQSLDKIKKLFLINLELLHPFMPFITEELWQKIKDKKEDSIMITNWPIEKKFNSKILDDFNRTKKIISEIRKFRKEKLIKATKLLSLKFICDEEKLPYSGVLKKLGNLESLEPMNSEKDISDYTFFVEDMEFSIPVNFDLDPKVEKEKLENELSYTEGFLKSVRKKLNNKKFTENAPKNVIENELKKESDAIKKIKILKKNLSSR